MASYVFMNGEFVDEPDAGVSIVDRGLTLADGVFDTMLVVNGQLQDARPHFSRLRRHAAIMGIHLVYEDDDLIAAASRLLSENKYLSGRHALRTTLTRGPGERGLAVPENPQPTLIMRASLAPPSSGKPVRLAISTVTRRNEFSPLSRIKSLSYADHILALREAVDKGADDAIILNTDGHIACATASNIFIREGDRFVTPPLTDGVLDGITRAKIISERNVAEESITSERLNSADEVILSNSIKGAHYAYLI